MGGSVGVLQPPRPHNTQSSGDMNGRCFFFCSSHIQSAQVCNLCLQILGQRKWMSSGKAKDCSGLKRLARSYISLTWASWQSVISKSHTTCSSPQGPSAHHAPNWRADITESNGGKALPSSDLLVFLAPSALLKCNNQMHSIKWLIDFLSQVEGMAVGDPVLTTEQLNIQFPS